MGMTVFTALATWSLAGSGGAGGRMGVEWGHPPEPASTVTALLGADIPGAQWLSLGAMVFGMATLMWTLRRQLKRRALAAAETLPTPAERLESIRQRAEARDEIETRVVEALEISQRLAAELDNKAARLERLIADADERIRRLERAAARGGSPAAENGEGAGGADPISRQIYALADEGLRPVEIARRLGQHTGKVELILALRHQ